MRKARNIILIALLLLAPLGHANAGRLTVGILPGAGGLGDQSFNDMVYAGLGKARNIHRVNLINSKGNGRYSLSVNR